MVESILKSSHPNDLLQKQGSPSCTLKTGSSVFIYFLGPTSEISEQPSQRTLRIWGAGKEKPFVPPCLRPSVRSYAFSMRSLRASEQEEKRSVLSISYQCCSEQPASQPLLDRN